MLAPITMSLYRALPFELVYNSSGLELGKCRVKGNTCFLPNLLFQQVLK